MWTVAPDARGRRERDVAQRPAERMREADVGDEAVAEEGRHASLRAIEELIGDHEVERLVLFLETAHGARREDVLDAEQLEAVDVRAEIELGREQPVPGAVTREEGDPLAAQRADDVRRGRSAERCLDAALFAIGELRHVVQAAAADDANRDRHVQLSLERLESLRVRRPQPPPRDGGRSPRG